MARTIQVFEHEKLTLNRDHLGRYLEPGELEKLYSFNDKNDNLYFTGIRDGITACKDLEGTYIKGMDKQHSCTLAFLDLLDDTGMLNINCGQKYSGPWYPDTGNGFKDELFILLI